MFKQIFYRLITGAYMFFTLYMSVIRLESPTAPATEAKRIFFNFLHLPGYALMTFLWIHCFKGVSKKTLISSALISIGYGILMEFLQSLTGYRGASWMDVATNAVGSGLMAYAYFLYLLRRGDPLGRPNKDTE